MLTDAQIKELLEWFVTSSQTYNAWIEKRRQAQEENHKWIQPQVIKAMSDSELAQRFIESAISTRKSLDPSRMPHNLRSPLNPP
jgi:hypothetical protein